MKIKELKNIIQFLADDLDVDFRIKENKSLLPKGAMMSRPAGNLEPISLNENKDELK